MASIANPRYRQPGARFSDVFLDRILPMPKPIRSIGDWYRQRHQDLDDLTDVELGKEIYLARLRRALDHDPDRCVWLWGREQACRAELDLRRRMPTEPQRAVHSCTPAHRERHMNERPAPKRVRIVDGKVVPQ